MRKAKAAGIGRDGSRNGKRRHGRMGKTDTIKSKQARRRRAEDWTDQNEERS